ncbi:MAG: hypothetical protein AB7K36_28710, partial [Chloroflexota bacterium]
MSGPEWLLGARRAPSAHNTQPWQFVREPDGRIAVSWAAERTLPVGDPTSRDLFLSLGAAVESACLRSLAAGEPLHFEVAPPASDAERIVGWLAPDAPGQTPDPGDLELAAMLDRRQTVRSPHLPSPVPPSVRGALFQEAERHGRLLQITTDRPTVRQLATLAGQATAALFADEAVHAELWQWMRLDPSDPVYQRDGLTADCLELDGLPLMLARQTMPPARMRWLSRLGLHHLLASDTARVARESAAICLLWSPAADRDALVETGRVLQRIWLLAAASGLTTHPLSALLDHAETREQVARLYQDAPSPCPYSPPWGPSASTNDGASPLRGLSVSRDPHGPVRGRGETGDISPPLHRRGEGVGRRGPSRSLGG